MYEYKIVDASDKKSEIKKGKATLEELKNIIPLGIYEALYIKGTLEYNLEAGNEIYQIKKIS